MSQQCRGSRRCAVIVFAAAMTLIGAAHADEYVVGILAPLTGPWATLGTALRNGITLALEQAEDAGTFREGVNLSLKALDDAGPPAEIAESAGKFVRDEDAVLLVGPAFSAQAEAVAAAANRDRFPMLSPAVSPGVTLAGAWAFRTGASPHQMIDAFSSYLMKAHRPKKIAIAYAGGNAGFKSQAEAFSRSVSHQGGLIVAEIGVGESDDYFAAAAGSINTADPDLVIVCMDAEPAAALAVQLRKAGLPERTHLAFAPAAAQPALIRIGGAAVENALLATDYLPELPGEQNKAFVAAFRGRFGSTPDRWAGIGYATGLIAAEAIRHAGPGPNRQTVRLALERVSSLAVPLGGLTWQQDSHRNPRYAPALFAIRAGAFVSLEAHP